MTPSTLTAATCWATRRRHGCNHGRLHGETTGHNGVLSPAPFEAPHHRDTAPGVELVTHWSEPSRKPGRCSLVEGLR